MTVKRTTSERKAYRRYAILSWHKQGGRCWICREELPYDEITADHVIALKDGGSSHASNIRAAHGKCNSGRHDKPPHHHRHIKAWRFFRKYGRPYEEYGGSP